jgi:hypothetical protein
MTDRTSAIGALLGEAEAAHGVYETTELDGVYDTDWPRWYAGYAVDHGIGELVGRSVGVDELAELLASSWGRFQAADPKPSEPWQAFIARDLDAALQASAER